MFILLVVRSNSYSYARLSLRVSRINNEVHTDHMPHLGSAVAPANH